MRIKKGYWFFKGPQPTVDVAEAVEDHCSDGEGGELERMAENLRLTVRVLGLVASQLPESAQLEVAKAMGFEEAP